MIGQTFSHYKILEKLGQGGMGVVYKAEDTKLDRTVALKFLPPHLSASDQDRARFLQEAKAAAALNHPNICTIHGIEEHDAQTFIVMEFVDGQTLREKEASLNLAKAVDIGVQIAEGLAAAHEKGIVHRDIKPENIMVRKDGIVQVMDFGLAKLRASTSSRLTKEGSTIGTAGYMSPEQVQGQESDHRSDIFSLGVLLYEMFTGEMPFKGVHETALMYEIVNVDPAPMRTVKPELDAELDRIVLECLQKDPDERYNAVKDIAKDLKRFKRESSRARASRITAARPVLPGQATPPAPAGRPWKAYGGYLLAAILALALVATLISPWKKGAETSRRVFRFTIDASPDAPPFITSSGPAISHDGAMIAYVGVVGNTKQIYIRRTDQRSYQPLAGTESAAEPAFSPDGQWIAYSTARQTIVKIPVSGGAPEVLCTLTGATRGITWASDNFIYVGQVSKGIGRVPAGGGALTEVTVIDSAAGESSHRYPRLLPDGKTLIYTVKLNSITTFDDAIIAAEHLGAHDRTVLVRGGMSGRTLASGHLVYVRGDVIYGVLFDADRLAVKGSPVALESGVLTVPSTGEAEFDIADNGVLVFAPSSRLSGAGYALTWMDPHGAIAPFFDTVRVYLKANISPDGKKVAVSLNMANNDIWMIQADRGILSRFTFAGGNNDSPVWSGDGRYVLYTAEKGGAPNIFRKAWDGSGAEERLVKSENAQFPTSVSPDGRALAFDEKGDIWILPLDPATSLAAGPPRPFVATAAIEGGAVFSPDGRYLAYRSDESGKLEIYVTAYPAHERKWQLSNGGGGQVLWSRDGKQLFYRNASALMAVDISPGTTFDYTVPRKLCELPAGAILQDVAPGGAKFLLCVRTFADTTRPQFGVVTEWYDAVNQKFTGKNE